VWRGRRQVAPRASGGTLPGRSRKRPFVFSIRQWLYLGTTIVAEVIATSVLKASEGFTRLVPSLVVLAGYATAFYFLSLTLRTIPLGIALCYMVCRWNRSRVGDRLAHLQTKLGRPRTYWDRAYRGGSGGYKWILQICGSLKGSTRQLQRRPCIPGRSPRTCTPRGCNKCATSSGHINPQQSPAEA